MPEWAGVLYEDQGERSLGSVLKGALLAWPLGVVAVVDGVYGRIVVTTNGGVQTALRAIPPGIAAVVTPVLVQNQTRVQWTLESDAWNYGLGYLTTICLPQLSKRTAWEFIDRSLGFAPSTGFALLDQVNGVLKFWEDFDGTSSSALLAIIPAGQTVGVEFAPFSQRLIFEGGTT